MSFNFEQSVAAMQSGATQAQTEAMRIAWHLSEVAAADAQKASAKINFVGNALNRGRFRKSWLACTKAFRTLNEGFEGLGGLSLTASKREGTTFYGVRSSKDLDAKEYLAYLLEVKAAWTKPAAEDLERIFSESPAAKAEDTEEKIRTSLARLAKRAKNLGLAELAGKISALC